MERFWVYLNNKVVGPVEIPALRKLSGFNLLAQVCQEGQEAWHLADEVIEIKAYFSAPPRGSSLIPDAQPDLPSSDRPQIEMRDMLGDNLVETLPDMPVAVAGNTVTQANPNAALMRVPCVTCGYKNPREVALCMKCSAPLSAAPPVSQKPAVNFEQAPDSPVPLVKPESLIPKAVPPLAVVSAEKPDSNMVEIPVMRIVAIVGGIALAGSIFFAVRHMWIAKHRSAAKHSTEVSPPVSSNKASPGTKKKSRSSGHAVSPAVVAVLPGIAPVKEEHASKVSPAPAARRREAPARSSESREESPSTEARPERTTASYTVVPEAYPLQHRTPAPVDSVYAQKRRGDRTLWTAKEEQAIQQVANHRIYGGLRTIRRNTEILMQILRDREYMSAFEQGKRIYLFNDLDWAASQKETPAYEVRLTLSGGKEADGSSRLPLRFAFNVDLERKTVEPGGSSQIKANTMRAFFDESRIPPEDRRTIAKDTEELVLAAQPNASPLALDAISRHYAATYSLAALTRIANAYGLTIVNKKLERETASVNEILPQDANPAKPTAKAGSPAAVPVKAALTSFSGTIQYTMEKGMGKDRLLTVKAPSKASPVKLWENLTAYDRLTQLVPDLLVSQREGQDGAAIIVHTVSLTRLMVFVFKVNLHLRIIEHPAQHRLEFERIAGDFEKFSGYVDVNADATGTRSNIELHATLVPKGFMPDWALRGMAEKFLVPVLDAVRAKSESN